VEVCGKSFKFLKINDGGKSLQANFSSTQISNISTAKLESFSEVLSKLSRRKTTKPTRVYFRSSLKGFSNVFEENPQTVIAVKQFQRCA
jgi:NRPS condensation-like uncharacterized protein